MGSGPVLHKHTLCVSIACNRERVFCNATPQNEPLPHVVLFRSVSHDDLSLSQHKAQVILVGNNENGVNWGFQNEGAPGASRRNGGWNE